MTARFYPNSRQERLEWGAARLKERSSQDPRCANWPDRRWISRVSPGDDSLMTLPVLDPTCVVKMDPDQGW